MITPVFIALKQGKNFPAQHRRRGSETTMPAGKKKVLKILKQMGKRICRDMTVIFGEGFQRQFVHDGAY